MIRFNRRFAFTFTAVVWACALGSAGALAYVLDRPVQIRETPGHSAVVAPARQEIEPVNTPATEEQRVLEIPTITITTARHPARVVARPPAPGPNEEQLPDIAKMNCTEWRELQAGSGRVQVCE
ncbi:MAG TPA: hypothetical protein VKU41_11955 [Polyangiaceae bacterium]|nr:hypothetical protein [Polyangiaceae bacterium]